MSKFMRIVIFLGILIGVLLLFKNILIKTVVEKGVEASVGLPLKIGTLDLGLKNTHIGMKEFRLFNPKGFPEEVLLEAPEVFVDYQLGDIIKGKIHLQEVRLNFEKLVVIRNAQGELNLNALKTKSEQEPRHDKASDKKQQPRKDKKAPDIQIDHLVLKVGKVIYKDYSKGQEPSVKEFTINLHEKFDNVTNTKVLIMVIVQKALAKTVLNSLSGLNMDFLKAPDLQKSFHAVKDKMGSFKEKIKAPF